MKYKKIGLISLGVVVMALMYLYPVNWGNFNRMLLDQLSGLSTAIIVIMVFGKQISDMIRKLLK